MKLVLICLAWFLLVSIVTYMLLNIYYAPKIEHNTIYERNKQLWV
jgi:hypothetical protein